MRFFAARSTQSAAISNPWAESPTFWAFESAKLNPESPPFIADNFDQCRYDFGFLYHSLAVLFGNLHLQEVRNSF